MLSASTFLNLTTHWLFFYFTLFISSPSALLSSLDEEEEEMKISNLQKKRNQLAGYCKLVVYGVLDLTAATDVFKHYSKVEGSFSLAQQYDTYTEIYNLCLSFCHNKAFIALLIGLLTTNQRPTSHPLSNLGF